MFLFVFFCFQQKQKQNCNNNNNNNNKWNKHIPISVAIDAFSSASQFFAPIPFDHADFRSGVYKVNTRPVWRKSGSVAILAQGSHSRDFVPDFVSSSTMADIPSITDPVAFQAWSADYKVKRHAFHTQCVSLQYTADAVEALQLQEYFSLEHMKLMWQEYNRHSISAMKQPARNLHA